MKTRLVCLLILLIAPLSGCSTLSATSSTSSTIEPSDYCPEVMEHLIEFDSAIALGMQDETYDAFPELETTVRGLALLVGRAESEGIDLQSPEARWLSDLGRASRAFLTVIDGTTDYLSDDEQRNVLANILDDFQASAQACTPDTT